MSHRARITATAMALVLTGSGCTMKKEFDHASATFAEKIDHLVRVDDHNEHLREENIRLRAENMRLQRKLAGFQQEERSAHVKSAAHHEGGSEASRVAHSLVPELVKDRYSSHVATTAGHDDQHAAKPAAVGHHEEHAAKPAAVGHHDDHASAPAGHGEHHSMTPADADDDNERTPASAEETEPEVTLLSAPPKKIFDTAVAAFQREEYDRAARGFVSLANNQENTRYATPEVNFMAGVSLFKVRNYQVSIDHLERVLMAKGADAERFAPKALMWKALSLKKLGRDSESRRTAQIIVERYPASAEAQKVK